MDLIRKLRQFDSDRQSKRPQTGRRPDAEAGHVLEGREIKNALGSFLTADSPYAPDHAHGRIPLRLLFEIPPHIFSWVGKDEGLSDLDIRRTVFLDTETTGLSGGTGTVPFLIGLGTFEEDRFRIEQFFMRDYDEERAMLSAVREKLEPFRYLVSYNGKAFDLGLLSSRFTLARIANPAEKMPHLDLLFTARRLWKRRLGDCSLGHIERSVLGFTRQDDVPGFIIPGLYFEYLRTRNGGSLAPVFRHNRWDILALAALAGLAGKIHHNPSDHLDHPLDFFSLGRSMESLLRLEDAAACYRKALDHPMEPEEREEALTRLGRVRKRRGAWEEAARIWESLAGNASFSILPYEELAKYHEHQTRDFGKALSWTERALERIALLGDLRPDLSLDEEKIELEIRLKRLKRKLKAG
jgi:uncharacterized protein